jgi:hypothetical protein
MDFKRTFVKMVPFSKEMLPVPSILPGENPIVFGSVALVKKAKELEWTPGAYYSSNFEFKEWNKKYGRYSLNKHSVVIPLSSVPEFVESRYSAGESFFVRSNSGLKDLPGTVKTSDELKAFVELCRTNVGDSRLPSLNELVVISDQVQIFEEYRYFVVDDKIATSSKYKVNGKLSVDHTSNRELDLFVNNMIVHWRPADAYCIDVATTLNGFRVVEINCINCSGFYSSDVSKLAQAIFDMENNRKNRQSVDEVI